MDNTPRVSWQVLMKGVAFNNSGAFCLVGGYEEGLYLMFLIRARGMADWLRPCTAPAELNPGLL